MKAKKHNLQLATFAAGCFWGVEESFRNLNGVSNTVVGFMGGSIENPTYEEVCTGNTGHAEVVQISYDPDIITYEKLLNNFWKIHDPTTLDKQGPDIGNQYRSVIFFYNEDQRKLALKSKDSLEKSGQYNDNIVTKIMPASAFYKAEEYHQQYISKNGRKICY